VAIIYRRILAPIPINASPPLSGQDTPAARTFYVFCGISAAVRRHGLADDNAFTELLLNEVDLVGVPRSGFATTRNVRFPFAMSFRTLEQSLARTGKALDT
jgi:aspartate aminotransferase